MGSITEVLGGLASLFTLVQVLPKIVKAVMRYWFELRQRLGRGWAAFKGEEEKDNFGAVTSFHPPPSRPSRQRTYFGPFETPVSKLPQSSPKGVWPPPIHKPEPNRDFMVRGPHATTDASRSFSENKTHGLD